ncbi:hypothetical protein KJ918_07180 [Patescibacteria group bacterium]|nr:hypothetical protein [Patescibacteria group bacterium]
MLQTISNLLSANKNILLIGRTDSGKTYFINNDLIPFLEKEGKTITYVSSMNEEINPAVDSVVILDEFEILEDKEFLEKEHPEERPYYSDEYMENINGWLAKAKKIKNPCIYIVTRNEQKEIDFVKQITSFSFKDDVEVVEFDK